MKLLSVLAAGAGVAATVALVGYFGAGAVGRALADIGVAGFVVVCLSQVALIAVMGLAWHTLLPGSSAVHAMWGRTMRDAGSEVLPLSQVGGYVLGARALALAGVSGTLATASTIVDVTLEFASQLAYTAIGLVLYMELRPDEVLGWPIAASLGFAVAAATGFYFVQRHGFAYIDRVAGILGHGWADRTAAGAAALHAALVAIYRNHAGLWWCFALHLVCWIASAAQSWIALAIAGKPLSFAAVLTIEALMHAIRTAAFFVPNAVGVQEAAYILLGTGFGLTPEMSLALSLLKRGRDFAIGLPALGLWQVLEGNRLWRRSDRGRPATVLVEPPAGGARPPPRD